MNYREIFMNFGYNSQNLKVGGNGDNNVTLSTANQGKFRREIINAIKLCVKNGWYDLLTTDEGKVHKKTERFLEMLENEDCPLYERLRESGYNDEADILLTLSSTNDHLSVKSEDANPILWGPNMSVYYEYRIVRENIDLYVKIVFRRQHMVVDIHGEEENYL